MRKDNDLMKGANLESIAKSFTRLGWLGFWIQLVVGILPLAMLIYITVNKLAGGTLTFGFTDYLALAGLVLLAFTACWSIRYTRLGKRIADPARCPTWSAVVRTLWIGLWAGIVGIFMSVLLLVIEVFRLLFLFMKAPQAGVPVIRTEADQRTAWVSAIDVVSLLTDLCTLIGELVVIGTTLWLLFRVTRSMNLFDRGPQQEKV